MGHLYPLQTEFWFVPSTSLFVSVAYRKNAGFAEGTPEDLQTQELRDVLPQGVYSSTIMHNARLSAILLCVSKGDKGI